MCACVCGRGCTCVCSWSCQKHRSQGSNALNGAGEKRACRGGGWRFPQEENGQLQNRRKKREKDEEMGVKGRVGGVHRGMVCVCVCVGGMLGSYMVLKPRQQGKSEGKRQDHINHKVSEESGGKRVQAPLFLFFCPPPLLLILLFSFFY